MPNLVKNIQNFAHQNGLWQKGDKFLMGVSGGADSVCLFYVFLFLAKKYDFSLHIAHVNYGLRGKDSDLDEKFVRILAKKNGVEISVLQVEKILSKENLESRLREIRYGFFEKIRQELKLDHVAVAHNQDDQAETVLLRLMRGSGMEGISSIKAKNGKIIRPLLETSRKDIMAYLNSRKIKFRIDKTNLQPVFSRNKIRLGLIPYLEKRFNPAIKETLASFAGTVAQDYDFINESAKKARKLVQIKNGVAQFDCKKILLLHPAVRRQILRRIIKEIKSDLLNIESGHIEEIEKILKSTKNKSQKSSFKGLKVTRKGDIVDILFEN